MRAFRFLVRICLSGFNWIIGSYNKDQRVVVGGFGGEVDDMHVKVKYVNFSNN